MGQKKEKTLVLLKPSALERGLCGKIINRFERAGLKIRAMVLEQFPESLMEELYSEHRGKEFFQRIVSWMSSRPVVALVLEGERVVSRVRNLIGSTDPGEARPGTIRGDFAPSLEPDNLVHASDSPESARREINLFFPDYK